MENEDTQINEEFKELFDKPKKMIVILTLIILFTLLLLSIGLYHLENNYEQIATKEEIRNRQLCEQYSLKSCSSILIIENKEITCNCLDIGQFKINLIGDKI